MGDDEDCMKKCVEIITQDAMGVVMVVVMMMMVWRGVGGRQQQENGGGWRVHWTR